MYRCSRWGSNRPVAQSLNISAHPLWSSPHLRQRSYLPKIRFLLNSSKTGKLDLLLSWVISLRPNNRSILGTAGHITLTPANQFMVMGLKISGHCPIRVSNQGPFDLWPNALNNCANRARIWRACVEASVHEGRGRCQADGKRLKGSTFNTHAKKPKSLITQRHRHN
jgi:hypothetical protein